MGAAGFDDVVAQSHLAWAEFIKGDAKPALALFSHTDDVTIANPFGPPQRGWAKVGPTIERAATLWREGSVVGFETVVKQVTPDLGYIVELERFRAKMGGSDDITPVNLRVTSVLRREDDGWKIVHRHADAITSAQPAESVVQKD